MLRILSVIIAYASVLGMLANEFSVDVHCPQTVTVGEKFNVEYEISSHDETFHNNLDNYELRLSPSSTDDRLVRYTRYIPSSIRESTQLSSFGGKILKIFSKKWIYTLEAAEAGTYSTPDFIITDSGAEVPVDHVSKKIKIINAGDADNKDKDKVVDNAADEATANDDCRVIVKAEIDKTAIHLGDSLKLYIVLLIPSSAGGTFKIEPSPLIEDCYMELSDNQPESTTVDVDGIDCTRYVCSDYNVIPLKRGKFKIKPVCVSGNIIKISYANPQNTLFSEHATREMPYEAKSDIITFTVD